MANFNDELTVNIVRTQSINREKLEITRQFRKEPTKAEKIVWQLIRNRKIFGTKWRRQQLIKGFIADFYSPQLKAVIEIDGDAHSSAEIKEYDKNRSTVFSSLGIATYRVKNIDCNKDNITELIENIINSMSPRHSGEGTDGGLKVAVRGEVREGTRGE